VLEKRSHKAGSTGLFRCVTAVFLITLSFVGAAIAQSVVLDVARARVLSDERTGQPLVLITFDKRSTAAFAQFTIEHVGSLLEVRAGDRVLARPRLLQPLTGGTIQIGPGDLDRVDAEQLARDLTSGKWPIEINVSSR
jgi:preprotein translocase subunit SecD